MGGVTKSIRKITIPIKIIFLILGMLITSLVLIVCYSYQDPDTKIIQAYTLADKNISALCVYTHCTYVNINGEYYGVTETYNPGIPIEDPFKHTNLRDIVMLTTVRLPDIDAKIYIYSWTRVTRILIDTLLPLILLLTLIAGYITESYLVEDCKNRTSGIKTKISAETALKVMVASTAYHEMMTPIAVIRTALTNIMSACSGTCGGPGSSDSFRLLTTAVSRLEAVLTQMSSQRNVYKRETDTYFSIIKNALASLQMLYTDWNFDYSIEGQELLDTLENYKLGTGTLGNIFNNLIKNSLEAGAVNIKIIPVLRKKFLEVLIIDDGHGIGIPGDSNDHTIIFERAYSNKRPIDNTITINKRLVSGTERGDGLYLVKNLLQSSGGAITLVRTSYSGTVFKLTLPYRVITGEQK